MPSKASRKRDCCWVSARVSDLRPLKMMGSRTHEALAGLHGILYSAVHTVCDHDTVLALDSLVRNGFGKVDG